MVTKTMRMKRASNVSGLGSLKELYSLYSTRQLTLKLYKSWHNDSSFHDAQIEAAMDKKLNQDLTTAPLTQKL